jgi:hypothetical protein
VPIGTIAHRSCGRLHLTVCRISGYSCNAPWLSPGSSEVNRLTVVSLAPALAHLGGGYRPGSVCRAILRACNIGPDRRVMIRRWRPLVTIARPPSRGRDALKIEGGVGTKSSFRKVAKADRWTHEFDYATCKVSPHGPSPAALMKHCRWKYLDTMMGAGSLTWLICVVAIGRDSPPSDSALPSDAGIFVRSPPE